MIILYSTGCHNCKRLIEKLDSASISYEISNDTDHLRELGFNSVPVLCVDGEYMSFKSAVAWLKGERNV